MSKAYLGPDTFMTAAKATSSLDISVLVPVMNEAGNIRPLIDEICEALTGRSFEIIYINDGSDDSSAEELQAACEDVAELRVFTHEHRSGQSAALRTGLLRARGRLTAVLDGDGQNVPADLPNLIDALEETKPAEGMAGGVRVNRKDTAAKRYASILARWIRRTILKDTHPDSGCGIKVVDTDLFRRLPFFNHMHRFMPALVRREGGVVLAVPVQHRGRVIGSSKYTNFNRMIVGISDLLGVIWLIRRSAKPGKVSEMEKIKDDR